MIDKETVDFPETSDSPSKYANGDDRFIFLDYRVDSIDGPIRVLQTFARFGADGGVDIISSTTLYESRAIPGSEEEPEHVARQVNISHNEMTKLAKAWLQWMEEEPEKDA